MTFTIFDAYTDLPIRTVDAPASEKEFYARSDRYIIDGSFDLDTVLALNITKDNALGLISALTQEKIFSLYPQTKQANLQARHSELMSVIAGTYAGTYAGTEGVLPARSLTESEIAELLAIQSAWAWIKTIRDASNVMVPQVNEAINAVAVDILLGQYKTLLAAL